MTIRIVSILLCVLLFAAPSLPQTPAYTIGMSQCNLGEPWRVQMKKLSETLLKLDMASCN